MQQPLALAAGKGDNLDSQSHHVKDGGRSVYGLAAVNQLLSSSLDEWQQHNKHYQHIFIIISFALVVKYDKASENSIFTPQPHDSCQPLSLICFCCCCGSSNLVQVLVWIRVVCFSAQLFGHLWRWDKKEKRGWNRNKEDRGTQECLDEEKNIYRGGGKEENMRQKACSWEVRGHFTF